MSNNYKGKNCLVTGASSGIGKEFAIQLHKAGANVILIARRNDLLRELADQLNKQRPESCYALCADLCNQQEMANIVSFINEHRIDLLVSNAGKGSFGYFEELNDEQGIIDLNVCASQKIIHAVIPQMKKRKNGGIISVASICSFQPLPFMTTYAASKAYNFIHALGLYGELKDFGVHVMALCPGPTATEFGGVARVPGTWAGGSRDTVEKVVHSALCAFDRKRLFVVPGIKSKLIAFISRYVPECLTVPIAARILGNVLKKSKA